MSPNALSLRRGAVWLLLVLALAAYANAFAGAFLFDDYAAVLNDPRLRSLGAFGASVVEGIRPFTKATFLVDLCLYGNRPAGYHALNLLLHLASGLLLFRILTHSAFKGADRPIAFWTTLLFLPHPMATETVTYISGRPTGLMTCAYLTAFWLFLEARNVEMGSARQKIVLAWAVVCLTLALLAKEVAIVFPALLLLYEAVLGRPPRAGRVGLLPRVHLPLLAVVVVFLIHAALHPRYAFLFEYSVRLRSAYDNLLTQANAVAYAMTLFFRPTQLNFDHDLPLYTSALQGPTPWSIAMLAGLALAAVMVARRAPLVAFGILWFFLHLLPTNSVLPRYDLLSERNLYLPSIGLYLAVTASVIAIARRFETRMEAGNAARWATGRLHTVAAWIGTALALGLVGLTVSRNAIYADPVAFWSDAVAKSPYKSRPHANLGEVLYVAGDLERAIEQFRIALIQDPLDRVAQRNLLETWNRITQPSAQERR
jgi:hypothetical protein